MLVQQLSIFLENKVGRLKEVTQLLKDNNVNIRTLTVSDTSDFGILRIIVDDCSKAEIALKDQGYTFSKTDVLAVEISDKPGGLNEVLEVIDQSGLNIEYLYAFVHASQDMAINIFRFDDLQGAINVLTKNNIRVLEGKELYQL
ncbi:MAG: ACT domain-containing protein [Candidatus Magnetoglobus multicellularis str. Araruama]|uniref:ACT domain-containing protein n=1 Tax=Candidatus Magnetoglobus multicellularis str. Araruama TaxID=890399 RepID=A0A1V1PB77_9BACT|nr:MAG: ACT domain-containing protein [Candidatus Magnetoglobus multicellularis str. Araruama]